MINRLVSDNDSNIGIPIMPNILLQGMTNNVWFTFGGSDTTWVDDDMYWTRHIEVVTLNTIFSVELEGL